MSNVLIALVSILGSALFAFCLEQRRKACLGEKYRFKIQIPCIAAIVPLTVYALLWIAAPLLTTYFQLACTTAAMIGPILLIGHKATFHNVRCGAVLWLPLAVMVFVCAFSLLDGGGARFLNLFWLVAILAFPFMVFVRTRRYAAELSEARRSNRQEHELKVVSIYRNIAVLVLAILVLIAIIVLFVML